MVWGESPKPTEIAEDAENAVKSPGFFPMFDRR
jgi:hypothetical protein